VNFRKVGLIFASFIFLISCKAEEVEIALKAEDIFSAAQGEEQSVEFTATFSIFGELDDEQRVQVNALENILDEYMDISDFELETSSMGYTVTIEGEMPLTSNTDVKDPYFLNATDSDILTGYTQLSLMTGDKFDNLKSDMQAINFMLSPDEFHPTKFKLKGKSIQVVAPAVEINGESYLLYSQEIDGRVSLSFKGGAFDSVGAGFFIKKN
jgi:hypothetical protein